MERKLFYKPRPIRIGYIIDSSVLLDDVKKIMLSSFNYFGGRYNQFFLLKSNNFTQEDYDRLQEFDADIYVSLCDISEELKDIIITRFSPLEIIPRDKFEIGYPFLDFHGGYLNKHPRLIYGDQFMLDKRYKYINFVCEGGIKGNLQDFMSFNFGYTNKDYNALFGLQTDNIHLRNKTDIIKCLNKIGDSECVFRNTFSQLSSSNMVKDVDDELITIVIGNTVQDYMYFRNNNDINGEDEALNSRTFIIPIDNLSENKDLIDSFINFLQKYIPSYHQYKIIIKSFSFSKKDFQNLGYKEYLSVGKPLIKLDLSEIILRRKLWLNREQWSFVSLYDKRNVVNLNIPRFGNIQNGENFMLDAFLEYSTGENTPNNFGFEKGYLGCNRNNNAYREFFWDSLGFPPSPLSSRINNFGGFSLLVRDNGNYQGIKVNIESELDIVGNVLMRKNNDSTTKIENYRLIYDLNFDGIKISNEGKKANAIFRLFGFDGTNLMNILYNEDWRNLFVEYNQTIKKDEAISIIKDIINNDDNKSPAELSEKIFNKVNEQISYKDRYITINKILKGLGISEDLIKKYNSNRSLSDCTLFSDEEIQTLSNIHNQVEELVSLGVLRQGLLFKCRSCGERYWIPVGDTQEKNVCRGCGVLNQLPIESEWTYAFNSMLKGSNIKGAFAVLHYLLKLREQYNYSPFIYGLGLECFENGKSITDCDILAIIDGRLFLSEVKYSWSLFSKKDFDKIKIIAERIKPNVIIFAAYGNLDKQTETKLNKWSSEIDKEFSKYGTKLRYAKIDLDELVYNPY